MKAAQLDPFLRPFENKRSVLIHDQSVGDIMQGIYTEVHYRYTEPNVSKLGDHLKRMRV